MNPATDTLPSGGLLCVEASAGTGKTHLLSTLAVRWLLEHDDIRIADLLVVSYTVASAAELRGRIRSRLADVRDRLTPGAVPSDDEYLEHLANSENPARAQTRAELALVEFDTATICTIHAFAAAALGDGYGEVGTGEERRRQAVTDVLAAASFDPASSLFNGADVDLNAIDRLTQLGLDNPDIRLAPLDGAEAEPGAWSHRDAVGRAIGLFKVRSRRDGTRTYSDLLTQLDHATAAEDSPVCQLLRARFKVGLIDEFQDTDPIQWRIFSRLFVDVDDHTLVVVGDPKQAIYGFRGADVSTYLTARSAAMDATTGRGLGVELLDRNYRSDGALLEALNAVFDATTLDEPGEIAYEPVTPTPAAAHRRLWLADGTLAVPLSIRVPVPIGKEPMDAQRRAIAAECASEAVRSIGAVVRTNGAEVGDPLTENDVVVLCQASTYFPMLREAFLREGVRTTETKSDDVLSSSASLDVAIVLRAMSDPGNPPAVAALAHSWMCSDTGSTTLARQRLASFENALSTRGVAALARAITDPAKTAGLLERRFGERLLTDLHHLFDVLADEAPQGAGPGSLLETLHGLEAASREGTDDDVRRRRIETDAPAVRMMTVHGAKGLEFGVVLCPFIQRTRDDSKDATIWREDGYEGRLLDAAGGQSWTDPRLSAATPPARVALAESAQGSESRRLQYVALTRARHRSVVWFLRAYSKTDARRDELAGLLFDRDEDHRPVQRPRAERADVSSYELLGDGALEALRAAFGELCERGLLELDAVARVDQGDAGPAAPLVPVTLGSKHLDIATLDRSLEMRPRRCSFSSLVAARHEYAPTFDAAVGDGGADDEGDEVRDDDSDSGAADSFGGLRGAAFGTCVHEALEAAVRRPRGEDFDDVATESLRLAMRWRSLEPSAAVAATLLEACSTPIDDGPALRALDRDDVVAELRFCVPVAEHVDLGHLGEAVASHDPDGPFAQWGHDIAASATHKPLATSLVGSIDLVTSLGREDRFAVIDYKTNLCGDSADAYGTVSLHAAMVAADYPLQALLYLVALHRYLRWRVADYEPERHLGGAHYLFLRGMRRDSSDGVFTWRPPAGLVTATSDLLAGAR